MKQPLSHVLLVTDMDGTLLQKDKTITEADRRAVDGFRRLGGKFTVATGRSVSSYRPFRDILRLDMPVVLNNGAVLYAPETGRILWHSELSAMAKAYLKNVMDTFPALGAEIMADGMFYVLRMNDNIKNHVTWERLPFREASADNAPECWYKLMFGVPEGQMDTLWEYIESYPCGDITPVVSSTHYMEMLPAGTSKGNAAGQLKRLYPDILRVYAAGDYHNDTELIRMADVGAAVAHAPDTVRKSADIILSAEHPMSDLVQEIYRREAVSV